MYIYNNIYTHHVKYIYSIKYQSNWSTQLNPGKIKKIAFYYYTFYLYKRSRSTRVLLILLNQETCLGNVK